MHSNEYFAGLFDGEGCVMATTPGVTAAGEIRSRVRRFPSFQVVTTIGLTHEGIIREIHEQFGGSFLRNDYFTRVNKMNRMQFVWKAQSKSAYRFLIAIQPFAAIKREQIELAIKLQEHIWAHSSSLTGPWATDTHREGIYAHRRAIADRIKMLKKHDALPACQSIMALLQQWLFLSFRKSNCYDKVAFIEYCISCAMDLPPVNRLMRPFSRSRLRRALLRVTLSASTRDLLSKVVVANSDQLGDAIFFPFLQWRLA